MKVVFNILLYIHQLPQNLIGLLVILFMRAKYSASSKVYKCVSDWGVSLGNYIIVSYRMDNTGIKHEQGHQKQSLYLGWLYLLIIGLPSLIGNLRWRANPNFDYYKQPWEHWADKLGGVKR